MLDIRHPFFIPLWRRIVVSVFCIIWGAVELYAGSTSWAFLFFAMGALAVWQFFLTGWPANGKSPHDEGQKDSSK